MSEQELRDIACRWFDVLNSGNIDGLDEIVSEHVIDHSGFSRFYGSGRTGLKKLMGGLRKAVPDWESQIDEITIDGDFVTIRHTGGGSYPAPFQTVMGRLLNSPQMNFQMVSTIRVAGGKIVEHWAKSKP